MATKKGSDQQPKGTKSGYIFFSMAARPTISQANPDMKLTEVSKVLGKQWKCLDEKQKEKYSKMAEEDKIRYKDECEAFIQSGGELKKSRASMAKPEVPQLKIKVNAPEKKNKTKQKSNSTIPEILDSPTLDELQTPFEPQTLLEPQTHSGTHFLAPSRPRRSCARYFTNYKPSSASTNEGAEKGLKQFRLELEDEKKKTEDLRFKVEENEIMASGDGDQSSKISEELQEKIKNLESQLQKSKSNLIDNQTEFQTKIKILESELEVQKKATSNHQSIVEQLNGITLELEAERSDKEATNFLLLTKDKEVEVNRTKIFEAEDQIAMLNMNLETLKKNLKAAKTQLNLCKKEIQAKNKEVEELKLKSERTGSETEKALQKKTKELLTSTTKLTEVNELLESFKEVENTQEHQITAMNEENEKTSKAYKKMTRVKESLEKEISTLRIASQNSTGEVKRLSATISSKDIEIESLKTDLASLSSQLQQLK